MSGLPPGLGRAFGVAVAELGLRTASWIFVEEVGEVGGEAALNELRDCYGRDWPVLDAVAAAWQEGRRRRPLDPAPLLDALGSADRIVCVGIETEALDLLEAGPVPDSCRSLANFLSGKGRCLPSPVPAD